MKNIFLALFINLIALNALGQLWNKTNAKFTFYWNDSFSGAYEGYKVLSKHSDTLINGKLFSQYEDFSVSYLGGQNPFSTQYLDTSSSISPIAFYEEDSVVFGVNLFGNNNSIDTIYNFKALPGDSWTINQYEVDSTMIDTAYYYCDSKINVKVLDTGHVSKQGISLYYLYVEYEGFVVLDGNNITFARDTIFERFGGQYTFISLHEYCSLWIPWGDLGRGFNLKCYSDNEINIGENCKDLAYVSSPFKLNREELLNFFPNPTSEILNITTSSQQIIIRDVTGKTVFNEHLNNGNSKSIINVSNLNPGVYFISTNTGFTKKLIISSQ